VMEGRNSIFFTHHRCSRSAIVLKLRDLQQHRHAPGALADILDRQIFG
jgi:hypothetical protein